MNNEAYTPQERADLQPAAALYAMLVPEQAPLRFTAQNPEQAKAWQQTVQAALREQIGFQDLDKGGPVIPEARILETVDTGDYVREKVLLRTSPHTLMPVYLLIPKGSVGRLPVVLALHGHGYGVRDIVGLWEDGSERSMPDGYHKDFGVALCRRGFLVAAPEISCFGERQGDFSALDEQFGQPVPYTCHHTAALAFHLGGSAVGLRVFDGRRLVDYLSTRPEANPDRIGAMGISGGGMHAFFSACLDPRIRACVISGYYSPFRDSIFAMHHCTCNYVPGLHRFGEIYDLSGLIAPRPMLIEAGTRDPLFPIEAVKESVARTREVYRVFGAENAVETDLFEGRHQISGARAYDFLWEALAG